MRLIKWGFVAAFVGLVCWHFWPATTKHVAGKTYDTVSAAAEAGYKAARK